MSITRGSEWRKWDLHVHTPASVLYNNFGDDWDNYIKQLFQKAIENNIYAIGITDYFSIKGYKIIKREYLENSQKMNELFSSDELGRIENILVFPNIEFRLKKIIDGSAVNFHVLFSDKISITNIEENFLQQLKFVYEENPHGEPETRSLTEDNLNQLGEKLQREHTNFQSDSSTLFTGMNNVKIDDIDITKVLNSQKSIFENNYFFAIPSDEDLSQISWDGQDHNERKLLIQKSHFLLSGNSNTSKWGLGEFNTSKEEYINEFKSIKPTLWGSDAHAYEKLFEPDLRRYTWIKADVTFEGLRQVLHEPERVIIQEIKPSQKNSYQTISEIRLIDNGTLFGIQTIGLSQDLNAIIGGKSSGKSLLLYHLAKAIMSSDKFSSISQIEGLQGYDDLEDFELEAIWVDGYVSKLSDDDNKRPIIYIPQMYLNYMAEKKSRNEDFKQTINEILKTNDGYSEFIDSKKNKISIYEQSIDSGIRNYFLQLDKLQELQRELHQLGDKNAITSNIQNINQLLEKLRETAGFTEEEEKSYIALMEKNRVLNEEKNNLQIYKQYLNDAFQKTNQIKNEISIFIDDKFYDLKLKYPHESYNEQISDISNQVVTRLTNALDTYLQEYPFNPSNTNTQISSKEQSISLNNTLLEPLSQKITNQSILSQKQQELLSENSKLSLIVAKEEEIIVQKSKISLDDVMDNYKKLITCYQDIVNKHEEYKNISDSIDLISEIFFNTENFKRDFSDYITKNQTLQTIFDNHGFNGNNYVCDFEQHVENIQYISEYILKGNVNFNRGKEKREIISALFKNYFDISYDLLQGNDRLGQMSPGKKGIILFQLFLHMSSSKNPILIDQPEDNLDNRTVYQELNDFIKEKKIQRQIIIVSHNSNLVVSTDSENIIVAHQNAHSSDSSKFEYVNGALENTFTKEDTEHILHKQGIREHVCEILEGGVEAFRKRERKYNLGNK